MKCWIYNNILILLRINNLKHLILYRDPKMDSTQVSRDAIFTDQLLNNLQQQQHNKTFTDFTIWVKDSPIHAHRNILSAACSYFDTLSAEAEPNETHLDDMDQEVMKDLVKYFYSGNIEITHENVQKLISACEYFELVELKNKCLGHICKNVSASTKICICLCKFLSLYDIGEPLAMAK